MLCRVQLCVMVALCARGCWPVVEAFVVPAAPHGTPLRPCSRALSRPRDTSTWPRTTFAPTPVESPRRGSRVSSTRMMAGVRDKITRAKRKLRTAMRQHDEVLVERLKAYIMHLRGQDPQYHREDQMRVALNQGLFGKAAKLQSEIEEIKQNPFRQGLTLEGGVAGGEGDISEDMSWGFDQSFHGGGQEDEEDPEGWSDI